MTIDGSGPDWAPDSCSLPLLEQPLRISEFDDLFVTALHQQQRLTPTRLRWEFDASAENRVRDLAAQETSCCSFFVFTIDSTEDRVIVDVEVPSGHVAVLVAVGQRAVTGPSSRISPRS